MTTAFTFACPIHHRPQPSVSTIARSEFVSPLYSKRFQAKRAGSPKSPNVIRAVATEDYKTSSKESQASFTDSLTIDVEAGNLRTAVWRIEDAVKNQTDPTQPVVNYRVLHQIIHRADETRQWELAFRTFNALERTGLFCARSTSCLLFNSLCRAGRLAEVEAVVTALWQPFIILYDGSQQVLDRRQHIRRIPDERMITRVANAAVDAGRPEVAIKMIHEMENNGVPTSVIVTSVLIKAYGRLGRAAGITKVLAGLDRRNLKPDVIMFNGAIDAYIRCGERALAGQVLRDIGRRKLVPNARSFNPILRALAHDGKVDEAFALKDEMVRRGVEPSSYTMNALIQACVFVKDWKMAARLLTEAVSNAEEGEGEGGRPVMNRSLCVGFTTVISGIAGEGQIDTAHALLDNMIQRVEQAGQAQELEVEVGIGVTSILSALLKQGDVVKAWTLFRSIRKRFNIRLPPDTYNAVIRGLAWRGDTISVDAAGRVFEEMMQVFGIGQKPHQKHGKESTRRERGGPSIHSERENAAVEAKQQDIVLAYNSMMDGFVRCGNTMAAERFLDEMEDNGFVGTTVSYTTLISGYGKELDLISTRRIFKRMRQSGLSLDKVTMNAFVGACVRGGDMELAIRVFEEMQKVGGRLSPNLTTFSAIIAGYVRKDDITAAWDTYEEMKAVGIVPNESLLDRMMAACVSPDLRPSREEAFESDMDDFDYDEEVEEGEIVMAEDEIEVQELVEEVNARTALIQQDLEMNLSNKNSGWASQRALVLLKDMEQCKCSEVNKVRWRKAVRSVWCV